MKKPTLLMRLAPEGAEPLYFYENLAAYVGADYLNLERIKAEVGQDTRSPKKVSSRAKGAMYELAKLSLLQDTSVMLDRNLPKLKIRRAVNEMAHEVGACTLLIGITAPNDVIEKRLVERWHNGQLELSASRISLDALCTRSLDPPFELRPDMPRYPEESYIGLNGTADTPELMEAVASYMAYLDQQEA